MSGIELGFGIIGAIAAVDVAIKACRRVADTCSALKHAETGIYERSTRLLSNCLQMETQLGIFRQIGDQLDDQGQTVQTHVLQILVMKLDYADAKLQSLIKGGAQSLDAMASRSESLSKRNRANYAIRKESLDKAIDEVEAWQRLSFNPLWFAMMKAQTRHLDTELDHARANSQGPGNSMMKATVAVRNPLKDFGSAKVFLPPQKLESATTIDIAFSNVQLVEVDSKWRLLDSGSNISKDTVRELAVRLKNANPSTFSLLTCLGAVYTEENHKSSLIFRMPETMSKPETLRAKFLADDKGHSLSDRFRVATQLAQAVFAVHTFDMVHKSIRPENIILFQDSESTLGSAFLLGFESIRRDQDGTRLMADRDWVKNLYLHPQRQGSKILDRYVMQHDVYSLGVCLLEIGLWSSFVDYSDPNQEATKSESYNLLADGSDELGRPERIKSNLLALATDELPEKMGTKYAKVVESCLTCLDLGNEDFGDITAVEDEGVVVAVRYIEKVLMKMSDISV